MSSAKSRHFKADLAKAIKDLRGDDGKEGSKKPKKKGTKTGTEKSKGRAVEERVEAREPREPRERNGRQGKTAKMMPKTTMTKRMMERTELLDIVIVI